MKRPVLIIGLSGLTGSGKTTISKLLRKQFRVPVIPVSYLVGLEAKKRGLNTREWAEQLVKQGGPKAVIESIRLVIQNIARRNKIFIVEGVYRPEDFQTVQEMFPKSKTLLITMETDRASRVERIMKRQKISREEAEKWVTKFDAARRSMGVDELRKMADISIHNSQKLSTLNRELLGKIENKKGKLIRGQRKRTK